MFREEEEEGVRIVWVRVPSYAGNGIIRVFGMLSFSALAILWVALQGRDRPPDVVIGSTVHIFAAVAGWAISVIKRAKFVYEFRDIWPETLEDLGVLRGDGLIFRALRRLSLALANEASYVISPLPGGGRYLAENGVITPFLWIPNGIDRPKVPKQFAPPPDGIPFRFMYLGSLGNLYNFDVLLMAVSALNEKFPRQFVMEFCGTGTRLESLCNSVEVLGLSDTVFFTPEIRRDQVQARLSNAHCLVLPSKALKVFRYGTSPNKLFDYLSAGRFILAGNGDPYLRIAESGIGWEVDFGDPTVVENAMSELLMLRDFDWIGTSKKSNKLLDQDFLYAQNAIKLERMLALLVEL